MRSAAEVAFEVCQTGEVDGSVTYDMKAAGAIIEADRAAVREQCRVAACEWPSSPACLCRSCRRIRALESP